MRVKQLKIQLFRGIRDLTLTFNDNNLTVFIGINGVGKSSILDCIAILLSWLVVGIQNAPSKESPFITFKPELTEEKKDRSAGRYFERLDVKN